MGTIPAKSSCILTTIFRLSIPRNVTLFRVNYRATDAMLVVIIAYALGSY